MSKYIEKVDKMTLPVVGLRGIVVFPSIPVSLEISDEKQIAICENAQKNEGNILFVSQMDIGFDEIKPENLFAVGTVAKVNHIITLPEGGARVFIEGHCRANVDEYISDDGELTADVTCKIVRVEDNGGVKGEALVQELLHLFDAVADHFPKFSSNLAITAKSITNPGLLSDFLATNVLINFVDKQTILEEFDPLRRAERLAVILERENSMLETEHMIQKKVKSQIESNQREYYLKEQLKAIRSELGYDGMGEDDEEITEYLDRIKKANLPKEVDEKLVKEVRKLAKMPYSSAESSVLRNYLDICIELPWGKKTKDRKDVDAARKILERDHDGLEKVKERILEFIAVKQLSPDLKNQILCLVGPPGTGKTSIGASIAEAMKRKFVRVSLGGIRDEADIRGHRKTYIGSMPGRIVNAIDQAQSLNPVILLDEIDKLTSDSHGDPASALLEVLDGEQNKNFRDHFIELPIDLSDCLFIATANTLETVPRPLIDRMEIIELKIYTRNEKLSIAKNHLIPKQLKRHGLTKKLLHFDDSAIIEIIDFYTREAGVRNLEREIAAVCRKAAKKIIEEECKSCKLTEKNVHEYLGERKIIPEYIGDKNEIGVVNGLAYTATGGDLLKIEVAAMPGNGKLELTGSLGDVMKESAKAAITYIRSHSEALGINPDFYKEKDIHIHVPEGAIPKDGPSAGVTMVTALVSELSGRPVRRDVAMTGEVTLRGRVLAIGGLKEKTMAAYKAGVKTVCVPKDNMVDMDDLDKIVKDNLEFVFCSDVSEVLDTALEKKHDTSDSGNTSGKEASKGAKSAKNSKNTEKTKDLK